MPIRIACPECSAALAAPDAAAGTVVKCPKCRAPMEVPTPPARRATRDDEDDRPRRRPARDEDDGRPRRRRKPAGGGFPAWAAVLLVLVGVGAVGAGVYLLARGKGGKDDPAGGGGGLFGGGGGVKYVPRESEKKFMALEKEKGDTPITEAEVLATMGEPTRRGPVIKGQKNGIAFTLQEWYWEVPGSGISSQMGIVNGVVSGQVIGLEVTPRGAGRNPPDDD